MAAQRDTQFRNTGREYPRFTDDKLEQYRKESGITVKGADVPYPIMELSEAKFPKVLHKIMKEKTSEVVSPLEGEVWSTMMSGRDAVVTADAGFQYPCTNVFLPPAIAHALNEKQSADEGHPIVLILCDNKEDLNVISDTYNRFRDNITRSVESRGKNTNPKGKLCFCFALPQGLLNLLYSKEVTLDRCNYVILYLSGVLDKGYESQVREVFKMFPTNPKILVLNLRWNMLLQSLVDEILFNYVIIRIKPRHRLAGKSLSFPNNLMLNQEFLVIKETDKYDELKKIIENCMQQEKCKIIVHATSKETVRNIFLYLQSLNYSVGYVHFESHFLSYLHVIQKFKNTLKSIIITNKNAQYLSRVGEVGNIDFAVNFDFPSAIEFYRSRIEKKYVFRVTKAVYNFMTIDDHQTLDSEFWALLYQKDKTIFQNLIQLIENEKQPKHAELLKYFERKVEEISLNNE